MMIAFITVRSSLVPLIEGLCATNNLPLYYTALDLSPTHPLISVSSKLKSVPLKDFFHSSFFLGFRVPNLITVLTGWCHPINHVRPKETVPDRFRPVIADPLSTRPVEAEQTGHTPCGSQKNLLKMRWWQRQQC